MVHIVYKNLDSDKIAATKFLCAMRLRARRERLWHVIINRIRIRLPVLK